MRFIDSSIAHKNAYIQNCVITHTQTQLIHTRSHVQNTTHSPSKHSRTHSNTNPNVHYPYTPALYTSKNSHPHAYARTLKRSSLRSAPTSVHVCVRMCGHVRALYNIWLLNILSLTDPLLKRLARRTQYPLIGNISLLDTLSQLLRVVEHESNNVHTHGQTPHSFSKIYSRTRKHRPKCTQPRTPHTETLPNIGTGAGIGPAEAHTAAAGVRSYVSYIPDMRACFRNAAFKHRRRLEAGPLDGKCLCISFCVRAVCARAFLCSLCIGLFVYSLCLHHCNPYKQNHPTNKHTNTRTNTHR